ncbi:hypothetical protein ACFYSH_08255 [Streptomyces sp. NPDC005791]
MTVLLPDAGRAGPGPPDVLIAAQALYTSRARGPRRPAWGVRRRL